MNFKIPNGLNHTLKFTLIISDIIKLQEAYSQCCLINYDNFRLTALQALIEAEVKKK